MEVVKIKSHQIFIKGLHSRKYVVYIALHLTEFNKRCSYLGIFYVNHVGGLGQAKEALLM